MEQAKADLPNFLAALDAQLAIVRPALEAFQEHGRNLLELKRTHGKHFVRERCFALGVSRQAANGAMKIATMKIDYGNPHSIAYAVLVSGMPDAATLAAEIRTAFEARTKISQSIQPPPPGA